MNDRRLRVSARKDLSDCLLATGIPFQGRPGHAQFLKELHQISQRVAGVRRFGSAALDLAWVAAGRYDGFWERALKPWDIAAGVVMIVEAGGAVSAVDGAAFDLNGGTVACANTDLHPKLMELLKAAG